MLACGVTLILTTKGMRVSTFWDCIELVRHIRISQSSSLCPGLFNVDEAKNLYAQHVPSQIAEGRMSVFVRFLRKVRSHIGVVTIIRNPSEKK